MIALQDVTQLGAHVLLTEARALQNVAQILDEDFNKAVDILLATQGRIIVIGMGKSGHIAQKIAATLASTGSPAFFVHPAEAGHGDMGMIQKNDTALLISNSGSTPEVIALLPALQSLDIGLVSITQNKNSTLGRATHACIQTGLLTEACAWNLAPTTSTTVALALGDALAICLQKIRGFSAEDYARVHPAGILGKKLTLSVEHVMHTGTAIPMVHKDTQLKQIAYEISSKRFGFTAVVDEHHKLIGMITDGDLRRAMEKEISYQTNANDIKTHSPIVLPKNTRLTQALKIMQENKITGFIITDETQKCIGVINIHDIWATGIS